MRILVFVVGRDRKTYMLYLQHDNGRWSIVKTEAYPRWLIALGKEYATAIWEQLHLEYSSTSSNPLWVNAIYNNLFSRAAAPDTSSSRSIP